MESSERQGKREQFLAAALAVLSGRGVAAVFIEAYGMRPQGVDRLLLEFTRMSKFLEPIQFEQIGRACAVVHRNLETARGEGEVRPGTHPAILRLLFMGGLQMILQTPLRGVFRAPPEFVREGAGRVVGVFLCGVGAK